MRKVLFLALTMAAILTVAGSRPVAGCTDWDQDGVCGYYDCNDYNPTIGYDGDGDGDGVTVCQGDCNDADAANVDKCTSALFQMYPVYDYNLEGGTCSQGFTITTSLYQCWNIPGPNGYERMCSSIPYYQYDTSYLRTCFP